MYIKWYYGEAWWTRPEAMLLLQRCDMTIPDNFPLGTYHSAGCYQDAAGNETTVTLKLIVVRSLMVTEAGPEVCLPTYRALLSPRRFPTSGFEMYLDPSVDWYYLYTDNIVTE